MEDVWACLRLSHSCIRLIEGSQLLYYGVKLGGNDMGVVLTVNDRVHGSFNDRGVIYVNR